MDILLGTAIRKRALICKDNDGVTPIHAAASRGHLDCLTESIKLIKFNDINVLDKKSRTPLMYAVGNAQWDCAEALMEYEKVDYLCVDNMGRGLMHRAAVMCDVKQCLTLIQKGADFVCEDQFGVTPLHLAAKEGDAELVEILLNRKAPLKEDANGLTPFEWAAAGGSVAVLEVIRPYRHRSNIFMSILIAASCNRFNVCKYLLDDLPECINAINHCGWTALHYASHSGYTDLVRLLVDHGADASAVDLLLRTPLMLAAMSSEDRLSSVVVAGIVSQTLINAGASIVLRDIDGNSALHLACLSKNEDVARYILKRLDPPQDDGHAEHIVNSVNSKKETFDERDRLPALAAIEDDDIAECASFLISILLDNPGSARTSAVTDCPSRRKRASMDTTETDSEFY
ncbi:unnamed protein product [Anisakis simplex]|uniref:ANK_REP_REGION domain-containing protein n=1 Tax=Anisakis simplex TaxID=6269 RepID=A0A0M3K8T6_ANISI|nr:unnamed protein product [Anisakis simplex]